MLRVPLKHMFYVVVPLIVFIATDILFFRLDLTNPSLSGLAPLITSKSAYIEAGTRYTFMGVTVLFCSFGVLIFGLFLSELFRRYRPDTESANSIRVYVYDTQTRGAALLVFAGAIVVAVLYHVLGLSVRLHEFLGRDLFLAALQSCSYAEQAEHCGFGELRVDQNNAQLVASTSGLDLIQLIGAVAAIVGVAAAAVASSLSLARQPDHRSAMSDPSTQGELPRLFLFLTSTLFTLGMVCIFTLLQFPKAVLSAEDYEAYRSVSTGISIYFGISYSLTVAGFYVPTSIAQIAQNAPEETPYQAVDAAQGRGARIQRHIETMLAVMAPMLAPLVAEVGATLF